MTPAARLGLCATAVLGTAAPGLAQSYDCRLTAPCPGSGPCLETPVRVRFTIDRTQFAAPVDPGEPPRRRVTQVRMEGQGFAAEPILMGDARGFHADAGAAGTQMLVVRADGSARYTETPSGRRLTGPCEVSN